MTQPLTPSATAAGTARAMSEENVQPPATIPFVTTEHFVLQGARAVTIAESTGRATMFLASVSGGLIALGLVASASRVGTAFYAFGLVLLPTLASDIAHAVFAETTAFHAKQHSPDPESRCRRVKARKPRRPSSHAFPG
jgi:hypothetical protein